ncbi:DUF2306 domain-containing protein [Planktotalea sp.]|uniref:DUF2306 domain-containing protein n=1 Tax=Planktotalea sp. TaxID=2029877 RepID=UPI003F6CBA18
MDFALLLDAPFIIQCHVICAVIALGLVPVMLFRRKGDQLHKVIGRIWVVAMGLTAISSFGIMDIRLIGPFSPIHGLSLLTLYSLTGAVIQARAGKIEAHKRHILGAMGGLVGAFIFTALPGRLMSQVLFPNVEVIGFIALLVLGGLGYVLWRIKFRHAI